MKAVREVSESLQRCLRHLHRFIIHTSKLESLDKHKITVDDKSRSCERGENTGRERRLRWFIIIWGAIPTYWRGGG